MTAQSLSTILDNINIIERHGEGDPSVGSLCYDSRDVREGSLFFALRGLHTDGHAFIPQAVEAGAAAVVHSEPLERYSPGVVYLRVGDSRRAMSPVSAAYFGHPSRDMTVVGVTGTDGKSTTVSFIHQLLTATGHRAGFLSTVQFSTGGAAEKNSLRQSTPEAPEVHRILALMRDSGCSHAVVEATSHGLSSRTGRLEDVDFDIGVFTNISSEHLEFHKTFEQYRSDKANLFRALPEGGHAVINRDDTEADYMAGASRCPVTRYSIRIPRSELYATFLDEGEDYQRIVIRHGPQGGHQEEAEVRLPLPGTFNAENLLAAVGAMLAMEAVPLRELVPHIARLQPVKGRLVPVKRGQPFSVIVDYAHTPGSFEKLFPQLRRRTAGRLIALFGSAGERDVEKRSRLGAIAAFHSDILVLADEDPRGENPESILREIAEGCPDAKEGEDLFIIPDRREAVRRAFSMAGEGDLVVLMGKGHEGSIIYADGPIAWDEQSVAEETLAAMGFTGDDDRGA